MTCARCKQRPAQVNEMKVRGITFRSEDTCEACFRGLVDFHYGIDKSKRELRDAWGNLMATDVPSPAWENHLRGQAELAFGADAVKSYQRRVGISIVGIEGYSP